MLSIRGMLIPVGSSDLLAAVFINAINVYSQAMTDERDACIGLILTGQDLITTRWYLKLYAWIYFILAGFTSRKQHQRRIPDLETQARILVGVIRNMMGCCQQGFFIICTNPTYEKASILSRKPGGHQWFIAQHKRFAGANVDQSHVIVNITRSIIIGRRTIRIPPKPCFDAAALRCTQPLPKHQDGLSLLVAKDYCNLSIRELIQTWTDKNYSAPLG